MKMVRLHLAVMCVVVLVSACSKTTTLVDGTPDTVKIRQDVEDDEGLIIIGGEDVVTPDIGKPDKQDEEDIFDLVFDFADSTPDADALDGGPKDLPDLPDNGDTVDTVDVVETVEVVDVDTGSCVPSCDGKLCGSDGCDGVCGYCAYGEVCSPQGKCIKDICPKQCEAEIEGKTVPKQCGSDGCGGYCGFCVNEGDFCGNDGFCYGSACTPDCDGKQCGPDGCGATCGFCDPLELCNEDAQCVEHPCGSITAKGKCEDKYMLAQCIDLAVKQTQCKAEPGKMCGWDDTLNEYACVDEAACEPECTFEDGSPKECGPDGCWSSCGVCPDGWGCGGGLCQPAQGGVCAWIDAMVKTCVEHTKWFCSANKLYSYDCMAQEQKTCGWDPKANFGQGGYDCVQAEE